MTHPLQIIMTPVRNEEWVIRAFLECNGLWADYIIIADQMSTDGTREIIKEYALNRKAENHHAEVIMIDNDNPNFNEAERQAMLVSKARDVANGRDTLLWGLDADEILPANWRETADGQRILHSVPGDVFYFRWANISPDRRHYGDAIFQPWLFHDDGVEPHGNYVRNMHSMRIPYPIEEKQLYYVNDFRVLHFGMMDSQRVAAKNRFYQFVDWELNHGSPIRLSRVYYAHYLKNQSTDYPFTLNQEWMNFPIELWALVMIGTNYTWFDDYIYSRLKKCPVDQLRKLDLWDEEFLKYYKITDNRRMIDRLIHAYLHKTNKYKHSLFIRGVDKLLKMIY